MSTIAATRWPATWSLNGMRALAWSIGAPIGARNGTGVRNVLGPAVRAGRCTHPIGVTGRRMTPPRRIRCAGAPPVGGLVRSGAVNRTVVSSRLPRCGHSPTARASPEDADMQILAGNSHVTRADRFAIVRSAFTAVLLLVVGLLIGWLCLATPLVTSFVPQGRPSVAETATGAIAWGLRDRGPGRVPDHRRRPDRRDHRHHVCRCARASRRPASRRPSARSTSPRPGSSSPAAGASTSSSSGRSGSWSSRWFRRRTSRATSGRRWELRDDRGRWVPIEAPVDRASRDAERVRGWLGGEDRDFVVRVYAAIVTDDKSIERTPACAVVRAPRAGDVDPGDAGPARPQRRAPRMARRDRRGGRRQLLIRARTGRSRGGW